MMEAAKSTETLVNFYQTTRRYNPEDIHLRTHRCENLNSYKILVIFPNVSFNEVYWNMKLLWSFSLFFVLLSS
jgi:hypothetical protein